MKRLLALPLLLLLTLGGCSESNDPSRSNSFIELTSISISSEYAQVATKTTNQLTARGNFSDVFMKDITADVTWDTSDPDVVTISQLSGSEGLATAGIIAGEAFVTAKLGSITSADFTFTVSDTQITAIEVSPADVSFPAGLEQQFEASGRFDDSTTQTITNSAVWGSSDSTVATVSNMTGFEGLATAHTPGTAAITATFDGETGTAILTATDAILESISVTPADAEIATGFIQQFEAEGLYSDASNLNITEQVSWFSSDEAIATISNTSGEKGKALGEEEGTSTISATLSGLNSSGELKVTGITLVSYSLDPTELNMVAKDTETVTATGIFSDDSEEDVTDQLSWFSLDETVATVDNNSGEVTAVGTGTTQIIATFDELLETVDVTVTTP